MYAQLAAHPASHHITNHIRFDASTLTTVVVCALLRSFCSVKYSGLLYSQNNNSPSRRHACIVHKKIGKNHWEKKLEESNLSVLMHDHDASIHYCDDVLTPDCSTTLVFIGIHDIMAIH